MILTDEHSMRSLGCYRDFMKSENQADQAYIWGDGVEVETPNIDRLANEGTLFSNFYTVAPLCTPSRASFMSGLYPQKTGESDDNHGRMDDDITTFAKILKSERDYLTAYLGKWHLNGDQKPGWGNSKRKFGFGDTTYQFNRGHWKFLDVVDGARKAYEFKKQKRFQDKEDKHFTTDFLFDRGIEFMESARLSGQPFASVLSIPDPHGPMEVRDPYQNMYKHFNFNLPSTAITALKRFPASPLWNYLPDHANVTLKDVDEHLENYEGFFQDYLQQYFGMVKCIDDNIGKLLDYLQRTGIDNDTIIV
jgi:arylsulfatase A-like enzyme